MTWSLVVRTAAQSDIATALAWYEAEAPEQLVRFSREFDSTMNRIAARPLVVAPFTAQLRRMALRIFPYQVWYVADTDDEIIQIVAVVHHR